MATLATLFRRSAPPAVEAEPTGLTAVPRRAPSLRPLPNEDVYFFSKRIDNSRIVRQRNPRSRGEWSAIGTGCAIVVLLITMAVPRLGCIQKGYQIEALRLEQRRLLEERANLIVQKARLDRRENLEQVAGSIAGQEGQALVKPAPGQVVHLNPRADGALALNVEKQGR
jgi:hypothetical protein